MAIENETLTRPGAGAAPAPEEWDHRKYLLYNYNARLEGAFSPQAALAFYHRYGGAYRFDENTALRNKRHIITVLGYTKVSESGARHTNWYPWNRFSDVFRTIGYQCEWIELDELERSNERRIFITWNEPTALELYQSGQVRGGDIVLQKLTSLGKGMEDINWSSDPKAWAQTWEWPIYRTVEYLADLGCSIYAFGCKTDYTSFPEKKRIVERIGDRVFWIPWGGTPFDWDQILEATPKLDDFSFDAVFIGSKWGRVGRGNVDAWERYLSPFEQAPDVDFRKFGGIGEHMVSDEKMVSLLRQARLCPILHAPSWQAERGVQDRFYTVFLSGRFGICDNLGAVDLFGNVLSDICEEAPDAYYTNSLKFMKDIKKQQKYIEYVQRRIKEDFNFYVSWTRILSSLPEMAAVVD